MHNITVKVDHYDEETNTLVVSFGGEQDGVHYETPLIAFHPSSYHPTEPELALKGIAQMGITHLEQEINKQTAKQNTAAIETYKGFISQQFNYVVQDIRPNSGITIGTDLEVKI